MKQYTLKGKNGKKNISFSIDALLPVKQNRRYSFSELSRLVDDTYYQPTDDFDEGYKELYAMNENKKTDFFQIKGTKVIIIPGNYAYTTTLTAKDIQ